MTRKKLRLLTANTPRALGSVQLNYSAFTFSIDKECLDAFEVFVEHHCQVLFTKVRDASGLALVSVSC